MAVFTGCDESSRPKFAKLIVTSGANQCSLPQSEYAHAVRLRTEDAKGYPVGGVKLEISAKKGSDLAFDKSTLVTDPGGCAAVRVTSGKITGDNYFTVTPVGNRGKAIEVRMVNGVEISGGNQEGFAGDNLAKPVSVKIVDGEGVPQKGVQVYIKGGAAKPQF